MARYCIDFKKVDLTIESNINDVINDLDIVPEKGDVIEFINITPETILFNHFTLDKDFVNYELDAEVFSDDMMEIEPLEIFNSEGALGVKSIELKVVGDGNLEYIEEYDSADVAYIYGDMAFYDNNERRIVITGYSFIF